MAYNVTGINQGLYVNSNLPTVTGFTVFFRFKRTSTGGTNNPKLWWFSSSDVANYMQIGWQSASNYLFIYVYAAGAVVQDYYQFTSPTVADNTWYDCAIVQSGSGAGTLKLYWQATGSTTAFAVSTAITGPSVAQFNAGIMRFLNTDITDQYAAATLDNIKVWNSALSASELENERWIRVPVRQTNIHYVFPTLTTTSADLTKDYSGNGYNATAGTGHTLVDGAPVSYTDSATYY